MANVFDVARHILETNGNMTAMKLQKLCYYSQVWHIVWEEKVLFNEEIQAWWKGPVVPMLYDWHRGKFIVEINDSLISKCSKDGLDELQKQVIDKVLDDYKDLTAQDLSDMAHNEDPWKDANARCNNPSDCNAIITPDVIHEYYSNLSDLNGKQK